MTKGFQNPESTLTCYFFLKKRRRRKYKKACLPPALTLYFSQLSHGGILEPADRFFSPSPACCDICTQARTHKHTPSLTEGSDIHSHTGRHPLSFENPQSPFTLQNPHTPRPVCLGTLHQRTHAPAYTHTLTPTCAYTLHRGPSRLIASLFDWCHLFHTFYLLKAGDESLVPAC